MCIDLCHSFWGRVENEVLCCVCCMYENELAAGKGLRTDAIIVVSRSSCDSVTELVLNYDCMMTTRFPCFAVRTHSFRT